MSEWGEGCQEGEWVVARALWRYGKVLLELSEEWCGEGFVRAGGVKQELSEGGVITTRDTSV